MARANLAEPNEHFRVRSAVILASLGLHHRILQMYLAAPHQYLQVPGFAFPNATGEEEVAEGR